MRVSAAVEVSGAAGVDDRSLKLALGQRLASVPRRVDRLSLLALLGAAPLQGRVRSRSGLYIAAQYPARPNMLGLLETVCVQQRLPKPFEFVNTVSNAAGFHVAQQLGLDGPNLFIGAGPRAWTHLLDLAAADFAAGSIEQALVLVCEEDDDLCVRTLLVEADGHLPSADAFAALVAAVDVEQVRLAAS